MTAAQLTFWSLLGFITVLLTAYFYPGVRRYAESARDSALASVMAALLCATSCALFVSFIVNAVVQLSTP